jgi:hypothetical protein
VSNSTYFVQECPTCGRRLQIRVEYLGREMECRHCHGRLLAIDSSNSRCDSAKSAEVLLRRADELLEAIGKPTLPPG